MTLPLRNWVLAEVQKTKAGLRYLFRDDGAKYKTYIVKLVRWEDMCTSIGDEVRSNADKHM